MFYAYFLQAMSQKRYVEVRLPVVGQRVKLHAHYITLLLIPLILGLTFAFKDSVHHRSIYVPVSTGVSSLIAFLNFPSIVVSLHSRPIYYDDLVINDYTDPDAGLGLYNDSFRRKYQRIFRTVIAVTSSLLIVGTTEIWYYRERLFDTTPDGNGNDEVVKGFVIIGVIGGIMRIYYGTTVFIGKFVIFVLKLLKRREQARLHQQTQERIKEDLEREGIRLENLGEEQPERIMAVRREASLMHDILS